MNSKEKNLLTYYELTFILVGSMIGGGLLSLPNDIVNFAKQDSWISAVIGAVYPLYIILVGSCIVSKFPQNSIMDVSKMCLGKVVGNALNLLFLVQFILYAILITAKTINLLRIFTVWFIPTDKFTIILILFVLYASYKGLKTLARVNVLAFYITLLLMVSAVMVLKVGSILNIKPIGGAGLENILRGSVNTTYYYAGMEVLLVIHAYVKDKKSIIKAALTSTIITAFLYTWVVFVTIYLLGIEIIPKSFWSFLFITESIKIPIVNDFRFIFMIMWTIVMIKTITNYFFTSSVILNSIIAIDRKKSCFLLYPVVVYISQLFSNEIMLRSFSALTIPWITVFSISYVTIIALAVLFRGSRLLNKAKDGADCKDIRA